MYCKKCICGHINTYELQGASPLECDNCGRMLLEVTEELYVPGLNEETEIKKTNMFLCFKDISIPIAEKTLIGRNQVGKEWLVNYPDVSREHFYIEPRSSGIGATIEDVSSFGTYLNGHKIRKNTSQFITSGTEIRLASRAELKFIIKGE